MSQQASTRHDGSLDSQYADGSRRGGRNAAMGEGGCRGHHSKNEDEDTDKGRHLELPRGGTGMSNHPGRHVDSREETCTSSGTGTAAVGRASRKGHLAGQEAHREGWGRGGVGVSKPEYGTFCVPVVPREPRERGCRQWGLRPGPHWRKALGKGLRKLERR